MHIHVGQASSLRHAVFSGTPRPSVVVAAFKVAAIDVYDELASLAGVHQPLQLVLPRETALGRGLVAQADLGRGPIASVPITNALVICDDPLSSISVFSDRQQRAWQDRWGELPDQLLEFIQGEEY